MKRDELLRVSNKNFKYAQDSGMKKYKFMDSWCFEYSKFLRNEVNNTKSHQRRKYKTYKRGSIVYAKLGINIGNEFSGNHFCVVLDKKDNRFNSTLTVIPLTSKNNKFNTLVEEDLIQIFSKYINNQYQTLANNLLSIAQQHSSVESLKDSSVKEAIRENEHTFQKMQELEKRYERYSDKKTYANINQITNISKDRINVLNEYDPIGQLHYSEHTLNQIDRAIVKQFTNIKLE
ncbi:type II toxin-antitoxin system PemK/MazF family toxin [Staphylococcus sp. HMSC65H10]|uniref:type II toxin-antitoxin system PemK/MazF family toxin n=1 Tax=Staphylococcus sp. HMSC65H10 TaxID=1608889 RepID=UPI0008A9A726|nr:type II toxin-antitoxin system PemK/MazF family toxin [Staphylococcus sp. HMSC65H10]OHS43438.1 hypothetical protein HMPREF3270_06110 [Staphylococcus sp. HMSC65H10]